MIESIRDRLIGYTFDEQFYLNRRRQITGWDDKEAAQAEKQVERELKRLRASFEAARNDSYTRFIMFLHYPPTSILDRHSSFTDMAEEYGVEQVIYAHGQSRSRGISTKWSIDWFPVTIWFGMLKYPQIIGHFH